MPGIVPKLSGTPGSVRSSAPRLGDDTDAVLREAGLTAEQIAVCCATKGSHGMSTSNTSASTTGGARRRILMQDVGPRDGLQMEIRPSCPRPTRSRWSMRSSAAGLAKIEVTAFVSPQAIPALRDAEIVLREIAPRAGRGLHLPGARTCAAPNARSRHGPTSSTW